MNRWRQMLRVCAAGILLSSSAAVHGDGLASRAWVAVLKNPQARPLDDALARVSRDGRYVALTSFAALTSDDESPSTDVYVFDLVSQAFSLESRGSGGRISNGDSASADISGDGRYVAFVSAAQTLVIPHVTGSTRHIYLRDRHLGTTTRLTTTPAGLPANAYSANPAISADGSTVVFESAATDFVPLVGAPNPMDVYLVRPASGQRERVSVASDGSPRAGQSNSPSVSADGRFVAFTSVADLTTPPQRRDTNGVADVYVRDTAAGTTTRVTHGYDGRDTDGRSYYASISGDGRVIAFVSEASNLTRDRPSHGPQVYVHDIVAGQTELLSRKADGGVADGASAHPRVSGDGGVVVFQSLASNLLCARRCRAGQQDTNLVWDVYLHDRRTGATIRLSADETTGWADGGRRPSVDGRGMVATFTSRHPRSDDDAGEDEDLFVRQLPP